MSKKDDVDFKWDSEEEEEESQKENIKQESNQTESFEMITKENVQ